MKESTRFLHSFRRRHSAGSALTYALKRIPTRGQGKLPSSRFGGPFFLCVAWDGLLSWRVGLLEGPPALPLLPLLLSLPARLNSLMSWRVCIYGEVLTRQGLGPAVAVGASETVRCRWLYATTCPGLQFVNLLQSLQPNYTTITVPCNWKRAGPRCEHSRMPVRSDADVLFLSTSSTTNPVHFCASTLGCRSMLPDAYLRWLRGLSRRCQTTSVCTKLLI